MALSEERTGRELDAAVLLHHPMCELRYRSGTQDCGCDKEEQIRAVARRAVERDGKAEFWERDGSIRAVVWDGERYVATDEPPVGCLPIESAPPPASESGLAERARDYAAGIRGEVDLRVGWNMAASLLIELADELDRRSVAAPAPQGVDVGQLVSDSWHAIYNCDGPDVCKTLLEHLVRRALGEAK